MFDFNPENNKAIQKESRWLLEYIREYKKYNYVINRIGDIYRIVRDDQAAYHAGDSLWADEKNTYVLLNESFLGVCFESKFDGASSPNDILTEAQIISGRRLTDVLRSKYNIDDANCTTHGLVAVDPDKMLIARHHDWVRYTLGQVQCFPFRALRKPVSNAQLRLLESSLPAKLPPDFIQSLKIHDGLRNSYLGEIRLFDYWALLPVSAIVADWIPFMDADGDKLIIDLDPGDKGKLGQVFKWSNSGSFPMTVLADSFGEWLVAVAEELSKRRFHLDEFGGICLSSE